MRRRWRDYATPAGGRPVRDFISALSKDDRAVIAAAMKDVRAHGTQAARHLSGEIFEVRAFARDRGYRILFAEEGRLSQVLLSLHAITKQTQRTRASDIDRATRRLRDRRERGRGRSRRRGYA